MKHNLGRTEDTTMTTDTLRPYGPGKFDTMLDAYVYDLSMNGCDDETGETSEGGWYGILRGFTVDGAFSDVAPGRLNDAETDRLRRSAGAIISEDSQGFVHVEYFDTRDALEVAWLEITR